MNSSYSYPVAGVASAAYDDGPIEDIEAPYTPHHFQAFCSSSSWSSNSSSIPREQTFRRKSERTWVLQDRQGWPPFESSSSYRPAASSTWGLPRPTNWKYLYNNPAPLPDDVLRPDNPPLWPPFGTVAVQISPNSWKTAKPTRSYDDSLHGLLDHAASVSSENPHSEADSQSYDHLETVKLEVEEVRAETLQQRHQTRSYAELGGSLGLRKSPRIFPPSPEGRTARVPAIARKPGKPDSFFAPRDSAHLQPTNHRQPRVTSKPLPARRQFTLNHARSVPAYLQASSRTLDNLPTSIPSTNRGSTSTSNFQPPNAVAVAVNALHAFLAFARALQQVVVMMPTSNGSSAKTSNFTNNTILLDIIESDCFDHHTRAELRKRFSVAQLCLPVKFVTNFGPIPILVRPQSEAQEKHGESQGSKQIPVPFSGQLFERSEHVTYGIPVELFEHIVKYLARDDVSNMRLINKYFEHHVSAAWFRTLVLPFSPEIYGMIQATQPISKELKGKGKVKELVEGGIRELTRVARLWDLEGRQNNRKRDGLRIFRQFGTHSRQFGMCFEVDEEINKQVATLADPPPKYKIETHQTFWGDYAWPVERYQRYEECEELEKTADETHTMTEAFSYLDQVIHLALSLDAGLGWLCGPDKSVRSLIFSAKKKVFWGIYALPTAIARARMDMWLHMMRTCGDVATETLLPCTPRRKGVISMPSSYQEIIDNITSDMTANEASQDDIEALAASMVKQMLDDDMMSRSPFISEPLKPNALTDAQKEWILENDWAQQAFLSSYILAVTDNVDAFQGIKSFTIARLSSRHIVGLQRKEFWAALPNLGMLSISVIADWRDVVKNATGTASTPYITPSSVVGKVYLLLRDFIAPRKSVKTLKFSWIGGGEHATGMFARNKHVLMAPLVLRIDSLLKGDPGVPISFLELPYIEHLALGNCWLTPRALKAYCKTKFTPSLQTLKLDSVSLSAMPVQNGNGFGNPPAPAVPTLFLSADQTHMAALLTPPGPPGTNLNFSPVHAAAPVPIPDPMAWLSDDHRPGSWPDVIDSITPGATLADLRYEEKITHEAPSTTHQHSARTLCRIEFVSCGYVALPSVHFLDHSTILERNSSYRMPSSLIYRYSELEPFMMTAPRDQWLGEIVPFMNKAELDTLRNVWGMNNGWGNGLERYVNKEDGMKDGGSGRFSGFVEKPIPWRY
ncbi:MAG: hypothetical protein M1827_003399 [Pycnora praestabilis]|nr:MAG: hypothetical protein M1827_003399 [Pycnora praestabilis]